jgi:pimeloyl-ACP methyl ester carboxylesterase/mannose-6-phosphate isomerase-like protein (cupin superfamily)
MTTYEVTVDSIGPVPVTVTERGDGRPAAGAGRTVLLLHGGGGPQSVDTFAELLAKTGAQVITPVHPGFGGTPRPEALTGPGGLAQAYVALLDTLDLTDVTVIGNSLGGWIAAEMAILRSPRLGRVVLVDAVGIDVPAHPVVDFFSLTPDQISSLSYHNPDAFRFDPSSLPPEALKIFAGNRATLAVYGGAEMGDASLAARLSTVTVPVLVVWGESDQIVVPEYGRAFAAAIPAARFELLAGAGHLPQIEAPDLLLDTIVAFLDEPARPTTVAVVGPRDGEITMTGPIQMRILEDGSSTAHRLGVGEITVAPHTDGPPQHRHGRHDEGFYVVSGTARFTVGDQTHDAPAGTFVMVPPGAPHTFANPTDLPTVLLNTFTPDLYVQYFRDLRDMVASGRSMSPDAVIETMSRYATEPATEFGR